MDDLHLRRMRLRRSRALVTAAGPQVRPLLNDLALPGFARYAARWDWQLLVEDLPEADAAPHVSKLRLLRQALEVFELVLWLDPETLLLRDDEDVAQHLHPDHFQALGLEHVPAEHRINPTTGVWLLRCCPGALGFLDAVEAAGPQPGPWTDQGSVLAALGWDRGDEHYRWARPGTGGPHLSGTSWLPQSWNQPYGEHLQAQGTARVPDPHALHFRGMTPPERYRAMAQVMGLPTTLRQLPAEVLVSR